MVMLLACPMRVLLENKSRVWMFPGTVDLANREVVSCATAQLEQVAVVPGSVGTKI